LNVTKVSTKWAKMIMIITTLFAPSGVYFFSLRNSNITVSIHALLWGIMPEQSSSGSFIFGSYIIVGRGLFYGIFNIWFGLEVIRYFNDYTRKRTAIIAGVLTIAYPLVMAIIAWPWIQYADSFVYMGPIPVQLVIGLLLMKYFGEPKLHEPWSD
jgi:hypothetical protein